MAGWSHWFCHNYHKWEWNLLISFAAEILTIWLILGGRYLDSTDLPLHPEIQSASLRDRQRTTIPEWSQMSSRTIRPEWGQIPSRTTFPWWGPTGAWTACPREAPRSRPCSAFGWRYSGCAANRWSGTSSASTPWGQFRRRSETGSIYPGNR